MLASVTPSQALEEPAGDAPPRHRRRWLLPAATATSVVLAVGGAAWWLFYSSPLEGGAGFGASFSDVEPDEVRSTFVAALCLDGAEVVTVDDVTVDPAGLTVTDFAVRPLAEPPGEMFAMGGGPLRETASGWSRTITAQCAEDDRDEVAIDLVRGVNEPAHTDAVHIHWSSGVRSGVHTVPASLTLCAEREVHEHCSADAPPFDGVR